MGLYSLVAVAGEEVGVQRAQIKLEVADAVGTVDTRQDTRLFARRGEPFEGHTQARHADYCVENSDLHSATRGLYFFYFALESLHKPCRSKPC